VQYQEAHTAEDALLHTIHYGIFNTGVRCMAPPGQHVGHIQHIVSEAVLWLILSGGTYRHGITKQLAQATRDCAVHAARVALGHAGTISLGLFVEVLAPYGDADR
jgi:hypothetical protein